MGTVRDDGSQQSMWVATADLPQSAGHPFYERLNRILEAAGFDAFVEGLCAPFYAMMGRPSPAPERYFRLLLIRRGSPRHRATGPFSQPSEHGGLPRAVIVR